MNATASQTTRQDLDFLPLALGECAQAYADLGCPIFLCRPGTKKPALVGWQAKATINRRTVADWWQRWPDAPIGAPMGAASELLGFDRSRRRRSGVR